MEACLYSAQAFMNTAAGSAKVPRLHRCSGCTDHALLRQAMFQRLHARDVARLLWVFATVLGAEGDRRIGKTQGWTGYDGVGSIGVPRLYADDPLVNKMSEVACEMVHALAARIIRSS